MTPYFWANILRCFEGLQCLLFRVKQSKKNHLLLLNPEAEGSIIPQNTMNYFLSDTVSCTGNTALRTSNFVPEETSMNVDVNDIASGTE